MTSHQFRHTIQQIKESLFGVVEPCFRVNRIHKVVKEILLPVQFAFSLIVFIPNDLQPSSLSFLQEGPNTANLVSKFGFGLQVKGFDEVYIGCFKCVSLYGYENFKTTNSIASSLVITHPHPSTNGENSTKKGCENIGHYLFRFFQVIFFFICFIFGHWFADWLQPADGTLELREVPRLFWQKLKQYRQKRKGKNCGKRDTNYPFNSHTQ